MSEQPEGVFPALLRWVCAFLENEASPQGFLEEHEALRSKVLEFGAKLEEISNTGGEAPDDLYQVAADLMEVLDILWDQAQGARDPEALQEAVGLLELGAELFREHTATLQDACEELSFDSSERSL